MVGRIALEKTILSVDNRSVGGDEGRNEPTSFSYEPYICFAGSNFHVFHIHVLHIRIVSFFSTIALRRITGKASLPTDGLKLRIHG